MTPRATLANENAPHAASHRPRPAGPAALILAATLVLAACGSPASPAAGGAGTGTGSAAPSSTGSANDSRHGKDRPGAERPAGPTAAPARAALTIANRFAAAWVRGDLPRAKWYAGVKPLCSPAFAARMKTVDPGNVPATKVTGGAKATSSYPNSVVTVVPTDSGTLSVTVTRYAGDSWLVSNNAFSPAVTP